jgi:predicted dehydrogenase
MLGAGLPLWFAREQVSNAEEARAVTLKRFQANDRIRLGFVGVGDRAGQLINELRNQHANQITFVAICDADQNHLNARSTQIGNNPMQFRDFRQLVARNDIDAVFVVTPDHWHALAAGAAMRAGKDVYCEKPLTLTVEEGKYLVRVRQATNKILQTGSQQRSEYGGRFRLACDLIRNGRIGTVRTIKTVIGDNPIGGPFDEAQVPANLDWNLWQGPTPQTAYIPTRCHYQFRWWYEYSGGKMTDWGAHHNDIAQWALNMDNSGPVRVQRVRAIQPSTSTRSYNCHPEFEVRYTYANGPGGSNGTILRCMSNDPVGNVGNGVRFEGDNGQWIFVSRSSITASDQNLIDQPLPAGAPRLPVSPGNNHIANFLACVRSRQQPICNVNVGHRSATVCHIGNIVTRLNPGQALTWDPQQQRFTNNEQANQMLSRTMRAPWQLEEG